MSVRSNIVFEDAVWEALQQTPRGERSRVVNEAVADWLRRQRRLQASERIAQRRRQAKSTGVSAEQLVREDRESH